MGEVPWTDCNCGRRSTATDPCPHCGAGTDLPHVEPAPEPEPVQELPGRGVGA
jgi:hypothetical protein